MFDDLWILSSDGQPVRAGSLEAWAAWRAWAAEHDATRVAFTPVGDLEVSTVFLGVDHNLTAVGPPLLYETMVFGMERHHICERYATRADAEAGHRRIVSALRADRGLRG